MALLTRFPPIVLVLVLWLALDGGGVCAQRTIEGEVKAAFLYNFTRYVEWPPAAFRSNTEPFRLCVEADAEFVEMVRSIVQGETTMGRPIELITPRLPQREHCHLLFVGRAAGARVTAALAATAGRPVLTVGETPRFLEQGGAVLLLLEENRVRFDIDLRATARAGLSVSSKLLRVARTVREGEER